MSCLMVSKSAVYYFNTFACFVFDCLCDETVVQVVTWFCDETVVQVVTWLLFLPAVFYHMTYEGAVDLDR